jgi:hypothetical protein
MSRDPKGVQPNGFQIPESFSYSVGDGQAKSTEPAQSPSQPKRSEASATQVQANNLGEFEDIDKIYEQIALEIESGQIEKGLWTRLYAEFDGDERKVKAAYIRARAKKLTSVDRPTEKSKPSASSDTAPSPQIQNSEIEVHSSGFSATSVEARPSAKQYNSAETPAESNFYNPNSPFFDTRQAIATPQQLKAKFLEGKTLNADEVIRLVSSEIMDAELAGASEPFRGDTLLHIAAAHDLKSEIVKLLEMGAPQFMRNGRGQVPYMVTRDEEIRLLLYK